MFAKCGVLLKQHLLCGTDGLKSQGLHASTWDSVLTVVPSRQREKTPSSADSLAGEEWNQLWCLLSGFRVGGGRRGVVWVVCY